MILKQGAKPEKGSAATEPLSTFCLLRDEINKRVDYICLSLHNSISHIKIIFILLYSCVNFVKQRTKIWLLPSLIPVWNPALRVPLFYNQKKKNSL